MLGSAATYIVGPIVVSSSPGEPPEPRAIRDRIMRLLYVCFGISVFVTVLVLAAFPKHIKPVSYPSKLSMASHRSAKLMHSLTVLVKNSEVWYLVLAFALSNTMSAPWSALLPSTFSKLHVPPELSAECGLFLIIHNFALSLTISTFADRAPGYTKELALISRLVSLVFLFWLMLMMNFHAKLTTTTLVCVILMAFPYCWCNQSLLYEMGAELMVPLPESFVAGYMTLLNNLFVDCTYVVLYLFPHFGDYWLHIGVFVFSVLSIIFLLLTTGWSKKDTAKTKHGHV
uniref:Disrupted in renal carcinoma protein 2 n=1 Tax=Sipha flava TaxID=143950 RepID=A0A2S2QBT6_9HEMI